MNSKPPAQQAADHLQSIVAILLVAGAIVGAYFLWNAVQGAYDQADADVQQIERNAGPPPAPAGYVD